jgi:RNA polymerase sigma factor (sigma-70 family)
MNELLHHVRAAVLGHQEAGLTDGQLLGCFLERRDEAAFAALVRRHAPMVWTVCRRLLDHHQDAEDAFQATFLVLVRKAHSVVPREMLVNWLYGVAYQTAVKARALAVRRRARERQVMDMPEPQARKPDVWNDLLPLLDEELRRLPDKYRVPLLLCDLEGKTRKEAARQLGWPEGTVAGRLARGRALLAARMARHGLAVSGAALAAVLARNAASAGAPAALVSFTIEAAALVAAGETAAGVVSPLVVELTEGVVKSMLLHKLKTGVALLSLVVLVCMTGLLLQAGPVAGPAAAEPGTNPKPAANERQLESLWNDLAATDEARVSRALLAFAAIPAKDCTAFLKDRLKPVVVNPDRVKMWLAELDSENFVGREAASRELEYLGVLAKPLLEKHLEGEASVEAKARVRRLLEQLPTEEKNPMPLAGLQGKSVEVQNINGVVRILVDGKPLDLTALTKPAAASRPNTQWLRAVRAVSILESCATAEARAVLQAVAGGEADAAPTREAREALQRLAQAKQP